MAAEWSLRPIPPSREREHDRRVDVEGQVSSPLRRRRARILAGGAAAVLVGVVALGALAGDQDRTTVAAEGGLSTTTVEPLGTSGPVSSTSTPTTAATPSTTTAPPCRNSTLPACGDFYYDYPNPNTDPTITIQMSPAVAHIGEVMTFTVTYDDPDGPPHSRCEQFHPDTLRPDPLPLGAYPWTAGYCADGDRDLHGPWDPPPPEHRVMTYTYAYDGEPGMRSITFSTEQGGRCPAPAEASSNCNKHVSKAEYIEVLPAIEGASPPATMS